MVKGDRSYFWIAVILLGATNALMRPVIASMEDLGFWNSAFDAFGINPAVMAALLLSVGLILTQEDAQSTSRADVWVGLFVLIGFLIPSATLSWIFLGLYAGYLALQKGLTTEQRAGVAILILTSFRQPIMGFLIHIFNAPILSFDAALTAWLLSSFETGIHAEGNLVMSGDKVRLVILTSCSSLANLSFALLFWYAACRSLVSHFTRTMLLSGVGVAVSIVFLNIIRLAMMASSSERYAVIHETAGKTVFALLMLLLVVSFTYWGIRNVIQRTHGDGLGPTARTA